MTTKIALWPIVLLALLMQACTQSYPTPEFYNKPAYYNQELNSLQELERSEYQYLRNPPPGTAGYYLDGPKSGIRFASTDSLHFVIKVSAGTDPASVTDLVAWYDMGDMRVTFRTPATNFFEEKMEYNVSKVGDEVYVLTAPNLPAGEYFFRTKDFMYAFGID